ncbi:peptidase inhibitor family I36 protein [Plantactinospora solaniradicis]|uniref:Peptidase inhibitor family I36 protein n=2 Tax=Plantactinospora solaniradicis TaxID=1723736 RepID=A0ABW1KPG2_9ACTN
MSRTTATAVPVRSAVADQWTGDRPTVTSCLRLQSAISAGRSRAPSATVGSPWSGGVTTNRDALLPPSGIPSASGRRRHAVIRQKGRENTMRGFRVNHSKSLRILVALSSAAIMAAAYAGAAAAAQTAPNTAPEAGQCEFSQTLCLFEGTSYAGARFTVSALNPTVGVCVDLVAHGWADRARSGINTNSRAARLYSDDDCTGSSISISGSNPGFTFGAESVYVY